MNYLCATFLVFCSLFNPLIDVDKHNFINDITQCAINYNTNVVLDKRIPIHLVVGVAAHETGYGTSRLALEGNNYFGMKTTNLTYYITPENNPNVKLAMYFSMCDSVEDFMELLLTYYVYEEFRQELYTQRINNNIEYEKLIKALSDYAVDKGWENKLLKIIKQLDKNTW